MLPVSQSAQSPVLLRLDFRSGGTGSAVAALPPGLPFSLCSATGKARTFERRSSLSKASCSGACRPGPTTCWTARSPVLPPSPAVRGLDVRDPSSFETVLILAPVIAAGGTPPSRPRTAPAFPGAGDPDGPPTPRRLPGLGALWRAWPANDPSLYPKPGTCAVHRLSIGGHVVSRVRTSPPARCGYTLGPV